MKGSERVPGINTAEEPVTWPPFSPSPLDQLQYSSLAPGEKLGGDCVALLQPISEVKR